MDFSQYLAQRYRQSQEDTGETTAVAVKQSLEELLGKERKQRREWEGKARKLDIEDLIQSLHTKISRHSLPSPKPAVSSVSLSALHTKVNHYIRLQQHQQTLARQSLPPQPPLPRPVPTQSYTTDLSKGKLYFIFRSIRNDIPDPDHLKRAPLFLSSRTSRFSIYNKSLEIEGDDEDDTHLFQAPGNPFSVSETFSEFYESVWTKRTEAALDEVLNQSYSDDEPLWDVDCAAGRRCAERNRKTLTMPRTDEAVWEKAAIEPLGLRLYRPVCPPTSKEVPATDASPQYGPILKYAFLRKRKGEQRKFHKRFIVLRGFRLYWYRNGSGTWAKGVFTVPTEPITRLRVNGQPCFGLKRDSKGRLFVLLEDSVSSQWPIILDNQSAYRALLEDPGNYHAFHTITDYFLSLHCTELHVDCLPLPSSVISYISRGLAAHVKLQTVSLVNCQLTDEAISAFLTAIIGTIRLESLDLSRNLLTHISVAKIGDIIKQEESQWNALMHLNLNNNPIQDVGLDLLSRAFLVRYMELFKPHALHPLPFVSLGLSNCELSDSGLGALYAMLEATYSPETVCEPRLVLDLSHNHCSAVSFQRLIALLPGYQPLFSLNIAYIGVFPGSLLAHFLFSLVTNFSLSVLNMTGLELEPDAVPSLIDLLSDNYVLTDLELSLTEAGLKAAGERFREVKPVFTLKIEGK